MTSVFFGRVAPSILNLSSHKSPFRALRTTQVKHGWCNPTLDGGIVVTGWTLRWRSTICRKCRCCERCASRSAFRSCCASTRSTASPGNRSTRKTSRPSFQSSNISIPRYDLGILCNVTALTRKVRKRIAVCATSTAPLWELTCHMGSHSVTCHPAEVTFPPLPQPIKARTRFSDPRGMQG